MMQAATGGFSVSVTLAKHLDAGPNQYPARRNTYERSRKQPSAKMQRTDISRTHFQRRPARHRRNLAHRRIAGLSVLSPCTKVNPQEGANPHSLLTSIRWRPFRKDLLRPGEPSRAHRHCRSHGTGSTLERHNRHPSPRPRNPQRPQRKPVKPEPPRSPRLSPSYPEKGFESQNPSDQPFGTAHHA